MAEVFQASKVFPATNESTEFRPYEETRGVLKVFLNSQGINKPAIRRLANLRSKNQCDNRLMTRMLARTLVEEANASEFTKSHYLPQNT